ncbi:MAG: hypothetical protein MJZ61_04320 [Bacteroidales bacterium]|nr:hypothetical protein [Bacteroidales bacterium]
MKAKLTFIMLLALLYCGSVNAQHLNFMGIPIDGTMEDFSNKLEEKGFKKLTKSGLKGTFAGYNCTINLTTTNGMVNKKDDNIANVTIKFNEYLAASEDIFHNLSKWLSVKYGNYDELQSSYMMLENHNYKVCNKRVWCTEFGTIVLRDGTVVELSYIDREKTTGNTGEEILNDL